MLARHSALEEPQVGSEGPALRPLPTALWLLPSVLPQPSLPTTRPLPVTGVLTSSRRVAGAELMTGRGGR